MPLSRVSGDPLLTRAHTLAFGFNASARSEVTPLADELHRRHPTAFAAYRKQAKAKRITPGALWLWWESTPLLAFLVVRETSVGATRPRYVDRAALTIARDFALHGITSLAIAPLGRDHEQPVIWEALTLNLANSTLPIVVYDTYLPNVPADEGFAP